MRSSNQFLRPVGDVGFSSEVKTSSRPPQKTSKVVKQKIPTPQANQIPKSPNNQNVGGPFGQSTIDRHQESRRRATDGLFFRPKSSKSSQKPLTGRKTNKNDEIIKHMSNLPGYLQQVDKGENLQEKALNFGVLDWESLEKWKHKKHTPPRGNTNASSSGSISSFKIEGSRAHSGTIQQRKSLDPLKKQLPSHCHRLNASHEEGFFHDVKEARRKVTQQDFESALRNTLDGKRNPHKTNKCSGRNHSVVKFETGRREDSHQNIISEKDISSSGLRKHEFTHPSKDGTNAQDSGVTNRKVPTSEPGKSFDGKLREANRDSLSDGRSSEEVLYAELYSEIWHSCPLPIGVETSTEPGMRPNSLSQAQSMGLSKDASCAFLCSNETPPIVSPRKFINENASSRKTSSENRIDASKGLDNQTTEPAAVKGRHSSPTHRFSFSLGRISRSLSFKESSANPRLSSTYATIKEGTPILNRHFSFGLGRMSRSFSFKEGSTVPQLSSTYATIKSGPVRSEGTDSLDNAERNKTNINSRAKSSPLRRLLDPLLKARVTNPHHSTEAIQSLTGNLKLASKFVGSTEYHQDKKNETSTIHAILYVTMKNGFPAFKLVANNNNDILVAVKRLIAPGKDNAWLIYTFYSVCEIKKKTGSWIHQGHKGKTCGFGYNAVGQMKFSTSHCPDLTVQHSEDQFTVRESVLYREGDLEIPAVVANRELAAVIVKIPSRNSSYDGDHKNEGRGFIETEKFNSTTVILPGGVHGLPNKGAPSPLIERWKSGGSCDCGGWDVGCKLRILTNEDHSCKLPIPSVSCSNSDHFDIFTLGGAIGKKPIFSLSTSKKGIYSVEFDASISLLQAFAICVEVISSQKSFDLSKAKNPPEAKLLPESTLTGINRVNAPTEVPGEVPAKYVPPPPLSPVGRV
ncbi:enolase, putative [Actinidia rufa]|uniref:Enolase, putative n=1 Tax=Actinidia rufa TaxID=165716 RepID=A0A7J0E9C3_9ERIC|nr:enolase, putative [Actinidia rufa]